MDDLEDLVTHTEKEITEKEFKQILEKLAGDKVNTDVE